MSRWFKKKYRDYEINPDEIFLDNLNVSNLDTQQFEGVMEKRIPGKVLYSVGIIFGIICIFFMTKLFSLQLVQGEEYFARSENNRLQEIPIFAERGVIYDRNGIEMAWNDNARQGEDFLRRVYTPLRGNGHLLGYVNYPKTDDNGNYWRPNIQGQVGLEKNYNESLSGVNGAKLTEVDVMGESFSEGFTRKAEDGKNLHTTVDARIQDFLHKSIEKEAEEKDFVGGAGAIMNIHDGGLLAFTSYPEFDPYTLADASDVEVIEGFFGDERKPFLNRLLTGLYSPGSTVKPFLGLAALEEGVITSETTIFSSGRIEIPNRFNPSNSSIFRDWRPAGHGVTDINHAIADSVNTFFYAIGGGLGNQEGLGIARMEEYLRTFHISEPTGIDFAAESVGTIPSPAWKEENFSDGTWRLGDTYNTSIGQFGFQTTPLQLVRATAALANRGTILKPRLTQNEAIVSETIETEISAKNYQTIHDAMRQTVTRGTAVAINKDYIHMTAKTGTAQVGRNNEFSHSWIMGFFPYEDPQYAYTIVMERAPRNNGGSAAQTMRRFVEDVELEYSEFWDQFDTTQEPSQ